MAKTYNQIKNSVLGKNYDVNSNISRRKEEEEKTYAEIKSDVLAGKYNFSKVKSRLENEIGLETLGNDITSLNKRLTESATGWQTSETMNTVRSSVEGMQSRLKAYKEYERLFGGGGDSLKDLRSSYTSAMDNWDGLIEKYGKYDNAETYTKETAKFAELGNMTSSDVEAKITEIKEIEDILATAKSYDDKLKGLREGQSAYEANKNRIVGSISEDYYSKPITETSGKLDEYLKSVGYGSVEEIEKALGDRTVAYTTVNGENITWQSLYDQKKEQEETDALYKEVSANEDFEKYKYEGMNVKNPEFGESKGQQPLWFGKDIENKVEFARDNKEEIVLSNAYASFGDDNIYYTYVNDQEREIYNYYLGKERAGELDKGTADNYLKSLEDKLKDRDENNMLRGLAEYTKESALNATIASGLSVWQNLGAGGEWLADSAKYLTTGELDDNHLARASSTIRGTVSNMVDWEIGNWDAFDFVYNTGMSMIDSTVAMATFGSAGGVALGLSAAAQGTNDALDRGLDNRRAFFNGLASGVFEGLFETYSISKFRSLKEIPSSGVKSIIKNVGKSMLTNASEETLTELANLTYDYISNGDLSQAKTNIRAYVNGGMSESEAIRKVALEQASQVLEAGASGALMGFVFGGVSSGISYHNSKAIGQNIKANGRAGDVFDLANNPEIASAYDAYTQYAKKGINGENASEAQVGSLAQMARTDAQATLDSKKSTAEQKASAEKTLDALKVYSQGNAEARTGSAKNFAKKWVKGSYDKESTVSLIADGLESAEGTESHKLAVKYMEKMGLTEAEVTAIHTKILEGESLTKEESSKLEGMKNLSVDEITKLSDANDAAIRAEENASAVEELVERGESKDVAELVARKIRGEILTTEEATKVAESDVALQYVAEQSNAENVTEELLEKAKAMPKKDAALFVALYDGKTDMEAYANAFNLAVMKSENNFSQDDIFKSKSVLSNAQVSKIFEEVRIKADKDVEAKFNNLIKATADKKFYKGSIDESVIDYDNKSASASGKVNWKDLDSRQKKAITFMNGFARATGINLVWTKDDEKANGKYDRASNTLYLDVYAGIDHADKLADTIIPTASHELTHWMEKKSPEFFRKINDLVFSTLYEHDGRTEEKRIKDEMARTGKSEAVVRSEIIARACEEVLSLSEQGKKIFNSLSKSEQKTFVDKIKEIIQDIVDWVSEFLGLYGKDSLHYEARVLHQYQDKLNEIVKLWDEALVRSVEVNQALEKSGLYGHVDSIGSIDLKALAKAVGINGESLFQYKAMVEDEAIYREMLLKHKDTIGITKADINALFDMIDKAVDIISENVEALDYAWDADIDDRAFNPVKPNSDKLYKVSLDFSTLCRKRLLQQTVQQTLQNVLNKQLSKEESIAIRDELMKVQEEGRKIEVACALCYVEAARMKSPEQIKKFLDNREASIREFFANRSGGDIKTKVAEAEMKAREKIKADNPGGYFGKNEVELDILTAPKSKMLDADAKFVRAEGKKARASYELTEHEQAELDAALKMKVTDFTSAKGLENLAKNHPDLFDAYTSFVRNATHSKGIESDVWWRAGDSDSIGDSLIAKMNEENGLRSQSWSDFQVIHLLDYIAATIELSTKGAKRQSYTKVPDYVKLLGNTGDMINLSLIPERVFDGKLKYDAVEGMAYEIAKKLRDEYHATVGTVCIGINDEQIKMLLMDEFIDYVIPYHHSSMSKATRKLMHIPAWESYQDYQNEKNLSDADALARAKKYGVTLNKGDAKYQKSPNFSEWFDIEEARQIAKMENEHPSDAEEYKKYGKMYGGYKAMQNAANNYLKLCAERGLAPKFSMGTDFTQEANYWKLLIDRKMVDNVTGEVIEQKAIKPIFNEKHVLEILTDELERYPQVKADQEYAVRKVTEKFLSGEMKVDASTLEAIKKPIDNITEVNILESSRDDVDLSERDYSDEFIDSTVNSFGIKKLGDYIHVQRQVLNTLVAENFFTDKVNRKRVDINKASGMAIETNKSGIDETFNFKNFTRIGKNKKITKLATIRRLPEIISNGTIIEDNVPNQYGDGNNKQFAYIEYTCDVDGKEVTIRLDIKKSPQKNKFWVHRVWEKENVSNFPASTNEGAEAGHTKADIEKTISHPDRNVKENSSEGDILYSERDDVGVSGYEKLREMQLESNRLSKEIGEIEDSEGYKAILDLIFDSNGNEKAMEEYNKWLDETGYDKLSERRDALEKEIEQLREDLKASDTKRRVEEEQKNIAKSGLSEADYFRKQAVKNFGYTPFFNDAGYILPNGKMLNFSGEKGQHFGMRGQDHRAIETIYAEVRRSEAMLKFMGEGNIRIISESPGIDISSLVEPSKEQYATIRKFVREYANERFFNVDITDSEGITVANYFYEGKISAERVANDIKYFFENGTAREQSSLTEFLSERDDVSVYDLMGEKERLQKQNKEFKAELERLRERVSIERKVTNNTYIDNNKALVAAGHIRNIANSTYDKVRLAKEIQGIYSYIGDADSKSEALFRKAYEIADNVLREAKEEKVVDDYFKGVLKDIRATRISLDDMQKQEARHLFGDHYNRNFIGRVIIAEDGISLDSKWKEWAEKYPDQFDADVNPNDQIGELYDIINTLQEASETVIEYDAEERKRWLTYELLNTFWNLPTVETVADKYEKRIKQIRAEHREAMTKVRNEYKDRLGKQRMADDIHYGRKISDLKKSSEEALAEQKKADRERFKQIYANIRERKDTEIALAKAHGREMLSSYKERAEMKTHIQSITSNALTLNEWLVKNSKEKHIHESLKGPVTNLLNAINFSSKSLLEKGKATKKDVSLQRALSQVSTMMTKASNGQEELVELYGHGLTDEIEKMMASVEDITDNLGDNEFVLQMMSLTDLQTLDKMVKSIKQAVTKMNKFHTVNHAMGIANLSQNSMVYLDSLGKGNVYDGMRGKASKLLNWGNALPYYVFKRYGEGGMKVYEALQDGWDKFSFNTKAIIDYSEDVYTSKEVKEWSEEIRTFKILVPASEIEMESENYTPKYQEVKLTVPQIMSMYCLNKREQARGHLFRGGIRVADFKDAKGNIVSQSEGVIFTEKDVQSIFNTLTDRQKKVADKLQEFMNTVCTDWGNEVSMARFGYKAFGEENYFPIQSDKNNLAVNDETEQVNSLFKLLNMSFTKGVIEKANNRIVISDIFDVFAQHTSDMAKYNALALPVLDAFKWYNYTEKQDVAEGTFKTTGVKQSIENAFGKDGQNYFTTFLKDINGQQEVSRDTLGGGFFKNAKISAVGLNLRVVLLQPTSYVRASAIIDNKYLTKAFGHTPKIKKAEQYCGIALWKSMGYYDTNVQKGVEAQIKHNDTWKDKATEISMKGAEWADKVTWGYLWNACELEVRDKRKDLKVGSEEFYDAISKRLREVIYATQVVDSTMTRSQMMRSTDRMDKMLTAFASEPTLSYNMLQDAYVEYNLDVRRMGKKEAIKKNAGKVARVVTAYTITNALAALVESAFDAFRDDDDEEKDLLTFMRKYYLSNFLSDMSIVNKIPYIKELYSFIQGFGSSRTDTQWMEYMSKAFTTWYKIATTGKGKPATAVKYSLKAISDISGLPFYNLYRDLMSGLDKLHLFSADELNEMFGDFLD